ncbi:MAG TPA: MmgE/PrpD family protein [Streptosporangiaceae bacterium]|nr:MmgE/PrpD family protein [Streptosporangiaceae bacterium]
MGQQSVTETIATYAAEHAGAELPPDVTQHAKRVVLDTLGCIYGGFDCESARAVLAALPAFDPGGAASLFGLGQCAGLGGAILYNGAMLRFLDYNDMQSSFRRPGPGPHNSEIVAPVLAAAEIGGRSGVDVLKAISLGYDISAAFMDGTKGRSLVRRGWMSDVRSTVVVPPVIGFLLDVPAAQIAQAMGIANLRPGPLGITDVGSEENTLAKNIRFPFGAYQAAIAIFLAQAGMTGPIHVLEGEAGFAQVLLNGEYDFGPLVSDFVPYRLRETVMKKYAACYGTHAHIEATIALVTEHDIKAAEVASVLVQTTTRTNEHNGRPIRQQPPPNKETADHSSYYLTAVAIIDRAVGPGQYSPARYADAEVRRIMQATSCVAVPEFDAYYPCSEVTIRTCGRGSFSKRVVAAPGGLASPMSDAEIEAKFRSLAAPHADGVTMNRIVDLVWNLDRVGQIGELTALLRLRNRD